MSSTQRKLTYGVRSGPLEHAIEGVAFPPGITGNKTMGKADDKPATASGNAPFRFSDVSNLKWVHLARCRK